MLDRYLKIRDGLLNVHFDSEGCLPMNTDAGFFQKVQYYATMLAEIDQVTKSLQTRGHTLASCREDINELIDAVSEQENVPGTPLYKCKLGTGTIQDAAGIVVSR